MSLAWRYEKLQQKTTFRISSLQVDIQKFGTVRNKPGGVNNTNLLRCDYEVDVAEMLLLLSLTINKTILRDKFQICSIIYYFSIHVIYIFSIFPMFIYVKLFGLSIKSCYMPSSHQV
jgi:hypothetical protein